PRVPQASYQERRCHGYRPIGCLPRRYRGSGRQARLLLLLLLLVLLFFLLLGLLALLPLLGLLTFSATLLDLLLLDHLDLGGDRCGRGLGGGLFGLDARFGARQ